MKLKSLNNYIGLLIFLPLFLSVQAEEEIDIWSKDKTQDKEIKKNLEKNKLPDDIFKANKIKKDFKIEKEVLEETNDIKIFGIYDPAENDFDLNMWSKTDAEDVRASLKRINKINLSNTSKFFFEKTLFSFAYPPEGMDDKEFINLKIDWMIDNNRSDLIEETLKQNKLFHGKKRAVQYLVDKNISKANIKESCKKISFLDKNIKDSYLEKFKIYCLVFNDKKNEAQLLYDILKEENQSDKFFDDKINFLLGITNQTTKKIKEDNLLNFYLSSITIENFKYEPKKSTKKEIWDYLNSANLIKVEDIKDKEKIKSLERAANQNQFQKTKIFEIYRKIPFDLNNLINAEDIYQTLDGSDARALIYQKILLTDSEQNKIRLIFLLEDLFKKDKLLNVYSKFMVDRLKEIDEEKIPKPYQETVKNKILKQQKFKLGKIKYDDKVLHRSKVLKYFLGEIDQKKTQKDFNKIYKRISKNKKYFFSAKDFALIESLGKDGIILPKSFDKSEISKKYIVPSNLFKLADNNESAFLALKIVEIIGEDEATDLDPETIYFITSLLNHINLKKLRNEIIISALPQRS